MTIYYNWINCQGGSKVSMNNSVLRTNTEDKIQRNSSGKGDENWALKESSINWLQLTVFNISLCPVDKYFNLVTVSFPSLMNSKVQQINLFSLNRLFKAVVLPTAVTNTAPRMNTETKDTASAIDRTLMVLGPHTLLQAPANYQIHALTAYLIPSHGLRSEERTGQLNGKPFLIILWFVLRHSEQNSSCVCCWERTGKRPLRKNWGFSTYSPPPSSGSFSTYPHLHSSSEATPWEERWPPRLQWLLQPPYPEPVHRGPLLLLFGYFQWENKAAKKKTHTNTTWLNQNTARTPLWCKHSQFRV